MRRRLYLFPTFLLVMLLYSCEKDSPEDSNNKNSHHVGEIYGGGVVFWVDDTGQHGLIVGMVDLSTSYAWSNITGILIGTTNDWDGLNNTKYITGQSGHTSSAAKLCEDYINTNYGSGTFTDWYLPSIAELNHMWNNFFDVQKALTNDNNTSTIPLEKSPYWSSTEVDRFMARTFHMLYGSPYGYGKAVPYYVRAIRAF